ncbi:MAG: CPBP family intramembrane metalloprotease [Undibacterium sp.]|nr:CPBP family intramembrane metalloprotease [Undibacterium sp.]
MKNTLELYAAREPQHRRTWTLAAIILLIAFFAVGGIAMTLVVKLLDLKTVFGKGSWPMSFIELVLVFGVASSAGIAWIKFFERRPLATIGFNNHAAKRYGRGLLMGFGFISAVVALIALMGGYQIEATGLWGQFSLGGVLALLCLFIGFMIQGATEEIFMRGWLFQLLTSRYGVMIGIVGNMLVFSLLHAGNIKPSIELFIGLFNIVLVAILLSLYALKEGSLWGVCAWHSAWNWLLGVGFGLEVSGQSLKVVPLLIDLKNAPNTSVWLNGGAFGPEASLVTSVVLLAGIVYFIKLKGHGQVFDVPNSLTDPAGENNSSPQDADDLAATMMSTEDRQVHQTPH